jgi:uncharacterized membrane protein
MLTLAFHYEEPTWLLLLVLIVPVFLLARRSLGGLSRRKALSIFILRCIVIILLANSLAHPVWEKRGKGVTTTILLDRSQSVPRRLMQDSIQFLRTAHEANTDPDNRIAVISIAREPVIVAMPDKHSAIPDAPAESDRTATNLAEGVRRALALIPSDTANRFILVSDGNETEDNVLAAAELAVANDVPIDILLMEYEHQSEVLFEQILAPAVARKGSTINLRLVLRSQTQASGNVYLTLNDERLDLNGPDPGDGARVELQPGPNTLTRSVTITQSGAQIFRAIFEPDDPSMDFIEQNNIAMAVTFVAGTGRVLVIDDTMNGAESTHLVQALENTTIDVDVRTPDSLGGGLVLLGGYDAVVLANVPFFAIDDDQDRALHDYVHDLGGGLVMLGGPNSFGAGSWRNTHVAKVLPVKLDPPETRQMLRGALALTIHSCEMPQGNFWGKKVAEAAIKALSSLDYVGIIEFGWQGTNWTFPLQVAGDKQAAINAAKALQMGDMPDFTPAMQLAFDGLTQVNAGQRHVIIISDGDASPPPKSLLDKFVQAGVSVTTVMVGGHGTPIHLAQMKNVAEATGGRFHNVKNPKNLPEIFFKEAQIVSRSLIQEGEAYQPQLISALPGPVSRFRSVPPVRGFVLTAQREGLAQTPLAIISTEAGKQTEDPVFAYWNYGLGRSVAYTSDITGRWGQAWVNWGQFASFWEQVMRWVMRPSSPTNMIIATQQNGDRVDVEIEAIDADAAFLNFLQTSAIVLDSKGGRIPLTLRQTGPGKYRGQFNTDNAGAYLINVSYAGGPAEERVEGTLQAAVCVPYPREFRDVSDNAAKLEQLRQRTGGRVLTFDDPTVTDLFEKTGTPIPLSPRDVWDLMAIIGACLFLIDVAARRLSIDPNKVRRAAQKAVGKRQEVGDSTMSAWKKAKSQVSHRRKTKSKPTGPAPDATIKFEADDTDAATAIDVGRDVEQGERVPGISQPRTPVTDQPPKDDDEGDYTSRLLAAKRRAKGNPDDARGTDSTKESPDA